MTTPTISHLFSFLLSIILIQTVSAQTVHNISIPKGSDLEVPTSATEGSPVTIKYTGNKYVKNIKIIHLPTTIDISPTCLDMFVGETCVLTATIYPDDAVDKSIKWSSDNPFVATVDENTGEVTAVSAGQASIVVTTNRNNKKTRLAINVMAVPNDCIPGFFSVGGGKRVCFSKGNLQYHCQKQEWRFAEHQYDIIGSDNKNNSANYNGYIDLFGWGTWIKDGASPTTKSQDNSDYSISGTGSGEFENICKDGIGNEWRILTSEEWQYLIHRDNKTKFGVAEVVGVTGLILLPDEWTDPKPDGKEFKSGIANNSGTTYFKDINEYDAEQWSQLESSGAVFLPAAGYRSSSHVYRVGLMGYYWSNTDYDSEYERYLGIYSDCVSLDYENPYFGYSVRLVISSPVSITINPSCLPTMLVGETSTLSANIYPDVAEDKPIKWSSSDPSVATIDETSGLVTAISVGHATITAATKSNTKSAQLTINVKEIPDDCLPGVFSVGDCKRVVFSKSNLQYNVIDNVWRLAPTQYDKCHDSPIDVGENYSLWTEHDGWTDVIPWGMWLDESKDNPINPKKTSSTPGDYHVEVSSDEVMHNQTTIDGIVWQSLSAVEWRYLITTRKMFGYGIISGVKGLIVLPDNWNDPQPNGKVFYFGDIPINNRQFDWTYANNYSLEEWSVIEATGALFLPACGRRILRQVRDVEIGFYWTGTPYYRNKNSSWNIDFFLTPYVNTKTGGPMNYGASVRLARPF